MSVIVNLRPKSLGNAALQAGNNVLSESYCSDLNFTKKFVREYAKDLCHMLLLCRQKWTAFCERFHLPGVALRFVPSSI